MTKISTSIIVLALSALTTSAIPSINNGDYSLHHQRCGIDPGAICGILGMTCFAAVRDASTTKVWRGVACGAASTWCVGQITLNEVVCHWKQKNEKDEHTGRDLDKGRVRDCGNVLSVQSDRK